MTTLEYAQPELAAAPKRQLTVFDSTCIIVGIIIGSAFYENTPMIAQGVSSPVWFIGVWVFGGVLSLVGALCYAELATAYPASGGDYVYLTRAFDRRTGFLFAWAQLWIVRPGSIGAMAYVFARYAHQLRPLGSQNLSLMIYAVGSVLVLTGINIIGVRESKWTQNLLTTLKAAGVLAIVAVGLTSAPQPAPAVPRSGPFALSLIMIFYAYGGWNEMAYVAAEVRDPRRNILRSLIIGTLAVTLIYVLANLAFLHALGLKGVRNSDAIAADVLRSIGGKWGAGAISALICITALGAINGMIFTGARINYAVGAEHRLYSLLGTWNSRTGTPIWSLVIQAVVTVGLAVPFGLVSGGFRSFIDYTTPVFWIFFLLVGASLFVLRFREPTRARPYRVPLYPIIPALFCLSSAFMVYESLDYAIGQRRWPALWSIVLLVIGVAMSFYDPRPREQNADRGFAVAK